MELPRLALAPELSDVSLELVRECEPLAAFSEGAELTMPLLFDGPVAALKGEELIMADAGEPLPWTHARADLDPAIESQVVDDIDAGERQVGIGHIPVTPAARRAVPRSTQPLPPSAAAQRARAG